MEIDLLSNSRKPRRANSTGVNGELAEAVKRFLDTYTVGELVKRGTTIWKPTLYSASQLLNTLDDFEGQDRIKQYARSASGHGKASKESLQMLKT
jgi:hypothetical protein